MKMTIESTPNIVQVNGVPARVWHGTTARGIEVTVLVTSIAADAAQNLDEFQAELCEHAEPVTVGVDRILIDHTPITSQPPEGVDPSCITCAPTSGAEQSCPCACHVGPGCSIWSGWCEDCQEGHENDLEQVGRLELVALWADMAEARRRRECAPMFSICMEGLAGRIVRLSRRVGVAPWETVECSLLRSGVYQQVHETARLMYPPIDWGRVAEVEEKIR